MASNLIDIEELLKPISEEAPCGSDVREDNSISSPYQVIKAERNQARAIERQSIHEGEIQQALAHWRKILDIAPTILMEQSKNLEVACWYTEAVLRHEGFAGLRHALELIDGLINNFWDGLYPMPDEYGMETRVSCIGGLNGSGGGGVLIIPIRKVPLTQGDHPGPYSLWQYEQTFDIQRAQDEETRKAKVESIGFDLEDIEKAVDSSTEEFYVNIRDDLEAAIAVCRSIDQNIAEKLEAEEDLEEIPSLRNIIETLDICLGTVRHIGKDKFPVEAIEEEVEEVTEEDGEGGTKTVVKKVSGAIETREDAFKQLLEIAKFFKKTEPHSPVSYVLQKAVKWGNLSLEDLMKELIPNAESRVHFTNLTGVEIEDDEEGEEVY